MSNRHRRWKLLLAAVTTAALATASTLAAQPRAPRGKVPSGPIEPVIPRPLGKVAVDPTTGAPLAGPIAPGTTIKYVLEAHPPGPSTIYPSVTVTDTMSPGLAYVPGSLQLPPGWSATPSPPFASSLTTAFTGTNVASETSFVLPVSSSSSQAGVSAGDGFTPVVIGNHVLAFNHHIAGGPVACWDKASLAPCSPAVQPATAITTMTLARYVIRGPRIYYPAFTAAGAGIACYDAAGAPCATFPFTPIAPAAGSSGGPVGGVVAFASAPDDLFIAIGNRLYCRSAPSMTPCTSVAAAFTAGVPIVAGSSWSDLLADDTNARIYVQGGSSHVNCVTTAGAACWTPIPHGRAYATLSPYLSPTGAQTGLCVHGADASNPPPLCFTSAGAPLVPPAALTSLLATVPGISTMWIMPYRLPASGGSASTEVFYPGRISGPPGGGLSRCFDFASSQSCAAFTGWAATPAISTARASLSDYGYMTDPADPTCTYGVGDSGKLFRFDTATGREGCGRSTWQLPDPMSSFCDGAAHTIAWSKLKIIGRPANLVGGTIAIGNGTTTLVTIPVTAASVYPLAALSYASAPQLTVTFTPIYAGTPPAATYQLQVTFTADAGPQICYQARTSCPAADGYTNAATFTGPGAPASEGFSTSATSHLDGSCRAASTCCPPLAGGAEMSAMFTHTPHPAGSGYQMLFDGTTTANVNLVAGYQAYLPLLKFLCPTVDHLQVTFIPHTAAALGGAWTGASPAAGFSSFSLNVGANGLIGGANPPTQFGAQSFAPGPGAYGVEAQTIAVDASGHPVSCGFEPRTCDAGDRFTWQYNVGARLARPAGAETAPAPIRIGD